MKERTIFCLREDGRAFRLNSGISSSYTGFQMIVNVFYLWTATVGRSERFKRVGVRPKCADSISRYFVKGSILIIAMIVQFMNELN